ncbi:MAG TPA: cytochrome c biogenesis protein CcdA [Actinomycetota bacterium]|nr:cytochrome c biogenesis protein CcdA [Actinomycetota bacterium]
MDELIRQGLSSWWAPALAFAAGVVSFASPCVFPLVPGYVSFVSGTQGSSDGKGRPLVPLLAFVAGFATVFSALGASSVAVRRLVLSGVGEKLAGLVIAGFGLYMVLYALRLGSPGMFAERRPLLFRVRPGPAGAFPLGMAFAAGWTPCIGPVLAGILAIAGAQGGALRGAFLLFLYSLGLGLPFVLLGLGLRRLVGALGVIKRNYHWIAGASGLVMLAIGAAVLTVGWTRLLAPILDDINRFSPPI